MLRFLAKLLLWSLLAVFAYEAWTLARVWWYVGHNPSTSAFMDAELERLQAKNPDAELRHRWVPYDRVSIHLKRALVAAEDSRFLDHEGFDWEGIETALENNLKKGRIVAGGSTISQQLAKNLFLSKSKTPWRKGQEAIITVMIENLMSKRRILEIYVNVIEWGNGVFGAQAAARYYFRTSPGNLNARQAARLAAMVPNPRYFDRNRNSPRLERRTGRILARMPLVFVPR